MKYLAILSSCALFLAIPGFLPHQMALAQSESTRLIQCDLNGDSLYSPVVVQGGKRAFSMEAGLRPIYFEQRYSKIACNDIDGDGADEIITTKGWRSAVFKLTATISKALSSACKTTRSLYRGEIWKARASSHISDRRKFSTSFITTRSTMAPRNNCLYGYDKSGNLVHRLGKYFPTGAAYSSRYYGGYGCGDGKSASTVASAAYRNSKSSTIYITSGTGNCAIIPNPAQCYNSSGC